MKLLNYLNDTNNIITLSQSRYHIICDMMPNRTSTQMKTNKYKWRNKHIYPYILMSKGYKAKSFTSVPLSPFPLLSLQLTNISYYLFIFTHAFNLHTHPYTLVVGRFVRSFVCSFAQSCISPLHVIFFHFTHNRDGVKNRTFVAVTVNVVVATVVVFIVAAVWHNNNVVLTITHTDTPIY